MVRGEGGTSDRRRIALGERQTDLNAVCYHGPEMPLRSKPAQSVALAATDPVATAHTVVLPKRHAPDYFDLSEREQRACWLLVNRVRTMLRERDASDTFRVGLNLDPSGKKPIEHAHLHVIPL